MLTHPKWTISVLCMLTAFDFGSSDFATRGMSALQIFPQSDLRLQEDSRWALPEIFNKQRNNKSILIFSLTVQDS